MLYPAISADIDRALRDRATANDPGSPPHEPVLAEVRALLKSITESTKQQSVLASQATPPGSPATGATYRVTATATGAWASKETQIAQWSGTAWLFGVPAAGDRIWDIAAGREFIFDGTAWNRIGDRQAGGDAAVTISATSSVAALTANLTANRTWTLPAANAVQAGWELVVVDEVAGITGGFALTVAAAGSDTINGASSLALARPRGALRLISDGASRWSLAAAIPGARQQGGDAALTISATSSVAALAATLTANRTWTLPAAAAVPPGWELVIVDETGGIAGGFQITVVAAGSDTINGLSSFALATTRGQARLISDGSSRWSLSASGSGGSGGDISDAADIDLTRRANGKGLWWDAAAGKYVHAWASPRDYIIDLRDLMDEHYGLGNWTQRSGVNTGSNITPALTIGLDRLRAAYGRGLIRIPPGTWLANTVIDPAKLSGIVLEGVDPLSSLIVWAGTGNLLHCNGAGGFTGGGWKRLGLFREDGFSSSAIAMMLSGDATFQPDQFEIDNIYSSTLGTGFWTNSLQISSIARTSPQGQRVAAMRNLQLFRSGAGNGLAVGLYNAVQCSIENIGTYASTGTLANFFAIGGGGASNTNSTQITVERLACGGELNLTNSTRVRIDGFCSQLNVATSADFYNGWIDSTGFAGAFGANSNVTIR